MDVVCIASGASLTKEDVEYCQGKAKVYVVNDCYKLAPWADALYACDEDWWIHHEGVKSFKGKKYSINLDAAKKFPDIETVEYDTKLVFGKEKLATGMNSGFQCLNLAYLHGATKIMLLGYDMGMKGKKRHWFGDHPQRLNKNSKYDEWVKHFHKAEPLIDIPVINCSRWSKIECFRKDQIQNVL